MNLPQLLAQRELLDKPMYSGGPGSGRHTEDGKTEKPSKYVGKSRSEVHKKLVSQNYQKGSSTFSHDTKTWTTRYDGLNSIKYVEHKPDDEKDPGANYSKGTVVGVTTKRYT